MEKEAYYQGNDIILVRQVEIDGTLANLTNYQMRLGISATLEDLSGSKTPTYITNDFPINSTLTNSTTRTIQIADTISQNIYTNSLVKLKEAINDYDGTDTLIHNV